MAQGEEYICTPRGIIRLQDDIFAGDYVEFSLQNAKRGIINKVLPRKNYLIRPNVANLDKAFIVIAPEPMPDLLLVDKMFIHCFAQGIEPILCYNKSDLPSSKDFVAEVAEYDKLAKIIKLSAKSGKGIADIIKELQGGLSCLLGQSAVGKSSILNALLEENRAETGHLSPRIKRGRNITRHIEIYEVGKGLIADTCGFSMLNMLDIKPDELRLYYDEYIAFSPKCRYPACTHSVEPDCEVIRQVDNGGLPKGRYRRYLTILQEVKEKERKKYG